MKKIHADDILAEHFNALARAARPCGPLLKVQVWTHLHATKYLSLIVGASVWPGLSREICGLAIGAIWIGRN